MNDYGGNCSNVNVKGAFLSDFLFQNICHDTLDHPALQLGYYDSVKFIILFDNTKTLI